MTTRLGREKALTGISNLIRYLEITTLELGIGTQILDLWSEADILMHSTNHDPFPFSRCVNKHFISLF